MHSWHGGSVCTLPCCRMGQPGGAAETLLNAMLGLIAPASGATVGTGSGVGNGASCGRCQLLACHALHQQSSSSLQVHTGNAAFLILCSLLVCSGSCSTCDYADRHCIHERHCRTSMHDLGLSAWLCCRLYVLPQVMLQKRAPGGLAAVTQAPQHWQIRRRLPPRLLGTTATAEHKERFVYNDNPHTRVAKHPCGCSNQRGSSRIGI